MSPWRPPSHRPPGAPTRRDRAAYEERLARENPAAAKARALWRTRRGRGVRLRHLRANPLCVACLAVGRTELATEVDHVVSRSVRPDLVFEPTNLQSLCAACHRRKTEAERRTDNLRPIDGRGDSSETPNPSLEIL